MSSKNIFLPYINKSTTKRKLKPILSQGKLNIIKSTSHTTRNKKRVIHRSFSKGDLSVLLFQGNEVNLVRNLDLYQNNNIWGNLFLNSKIKNDIMNDKDYDFRTKPMESEINLSKAKSLTIKGILESEHKLNQNKKEAQKNLAYSQLELELCSELKKLRQEFKEKKDEKNNFFINYKKMLEDIEKIKLELHIMNSKEINNSIFEQKNKMKEIEKNNETIDMINKKNNEPFDEEENEQNDTIKKNNEHESSENKIMKLKNLFKFQKEQEMLRKLKFDKLNTLKSKVSNINEPLMKLNNEIFEIKKKERMVINKLMTHYETLLFRGEEVRNEGLIWIIKAIWNLGENVPMTFIPPFLDFHSIEFLFQYAHKSIELENNKKILNDLKSKLQAKMHKLFYSSKSSGRYSSSFEFKTDLIKRNSIAKRSIKEHNFINAYIKASEFEEDNKNVSTLREMRNLMENKKNSINLNKLQGIEQIDEMKLKIKEIENEIANLKKKETLRLFKEFVENDYENKYHVKIEVVLAALLGEHNKNIEINKYSKYRKDYIDELKNIRFYQYAKEKSSS